MVNIASDFARSIAGMMSPAIVPGARRDACDDPCAMPGSGWATFAGIEGGTSRWNTGGGSRTYLDHMSVAAGLGFRSQAFLIAGYFEGGWGKYDAKLGGVKRVNNDKTDYLGGGILARATFDRFYVEGGFHAGRNKTDFDATLGGLRDSYKIKSTYYGADAILGYQVPTGDSVLDVSARYSWRTA